jgi:hypothetical protein
VAPLRYGAGIKGKVNMSMSRGQPVVATPMAVEGMFAKSGRDVLVADTAEEFAAEIVRLYSDEALWNQISAAGLENVRQYLGAMEPDFRGGAGKRPPVFFSGNRQPGSAGVTEYPEPGLTVNSSKVVYKAE